MFTGWKYAVASTFVLLVILGSKNVTLNAAFPACGSVQLLECQVGGC